MKRKRGPCLSFALGPWIRPHLTLYAITHTWSSAMLGGSVATMVLGVMLWDLPGDVLQFSLANWTLFNVFKFARKTYAPEEERPEVETYSLNFGPRGAVALTLSQVAVAWAVVSHVGPQQVGYQAWFAGTSVLFAGLGLAYAVTPTKPIAKAFRGGSGAWMVAFLAALAVHAVRG